MKRVQHSDSWIDVLINVNNYNGLSTTAAALIGNSIYLKKGYKNPMCFVD